MICWRPATTYVSIRGADWLMGGRLKGEQRTEIRLDKTKNPPAEPGADRGTLRERFAGAGGCPGNAASAIRRNWKAPRSA
jgi:hypothetical protein